MQIPTKCAPIEDLAWGAGTVAGAALCVLALPLFLAIYAVYKVVDFNRKR